MAKQTFTTGQVLTAAQMTSLQETAMGGGAASTKTASYVLVAADAGTTVAMNAAGATTITVNTGLFAAGDTVFIQNIGAGVCTITAGTATVNTAGSLILPQYDAGILYFSSASAAIFYDYIQVGAASPLTTKGDLYTYSTSDTRLGVGANGTVLTADSAETTGLKWAAPAGGAYTSLASGSLSGGSLSLTSISGSYEDLILVLDGAYTGAGGGRDIAITFNSDTGANYGHLKTSLAGVVTSANAANNIRTGNDSIGGSSGAKSPGYYVFHNYASSASRKTVAWWNGRDSSTGYTGMGFWENDNAITSITATLNADTFSGGTYILYGVK